MYENRTELNWQKEQQEQEITRKKMFFKINECGGRDSVNTAYETL